MGPIQPITFRLLDCGAVCTTFLDRLAGVGAPRPDGHAAGASETFGDEVTAAAMIDRLVHHAEILALKGDSYRLRDKDLGPRPPAQTSKNT